ncbi:MAG TPA: hypothetical protein DCL44_09745 [Elusimicrobia bacterium]|nr:hypothetical protein [Elusimicrobiota bacterium]
MNNYNYIHYQTKPRRHWLTIMVMGLILTAAAIAGIKFFIGSGGQDSGFSNSAAPDFKFQNKRNQPQGYTPLTRSETASGNSLEIFAKTNAGYSKEDSFSIEQSTVAAEIPKKIKPAPSKKAAKIKRPAAARKRTAIPKMQAMKPFGTAAGIGSNTAAPQGTEMPDIANILKQAQQKAGKQGE